MDAFPLQAHRVVHDLDISVGTEAVTFLFNLLDY